MFWNTEHAYLSTVTTDLRVKKSGYLCLRPSCGQGINSTPQVKTATEPVQHLSKHSCGCTYTAGWPLEFSRLNGIHEGCEWDTDTLSVTLPLATTEPCAKALSPGTCVLSSFLIHTHTSKLSDTNISHTDTYNRPIKSNYHKWGEGGGGERFLWDSFPSAPCITLT